jgi:hypothetical protein
VEDIMTKYTLIAVCSLLAAGCADDVAVEVDDTPNAPEGAVSETGDDAVATLARGGDFGFAFDESEVYAKFQQKCASAPLPDACMAEIAAQAATEGLEFKPLGDNRVRFISYGEDEGKHTVYIDAELTLKPLGDGVLEMVVDRIHAGKRPPADAQLMIEVVDGNTIAMDKMPGAHPRTGGTRLVFHRAAR